MKALKIVVPLFVIIPRKTKSDRKLILNLNNYPRWHYRTYGQAKEIFSNNLTQELYRLKLSTPISIIYTYFKGANRKSDRANVLAVIDKFFCDALVNHGCIPDDTDEFISDQHFFSGETDKNNPRVEIVITSQ